MFEEVDARRERLKRQMPFDRQLQARLSRALDPLFIYNSNALEGNTLSLGDTIYFIEQKRLPGGKKEEEILEVKGQQAALQYLREAVNGRFELSEKLVREFHALLTEGLPHDRYEPGQYKSRDNTVPLNEESFLPCVSAVETPAAMGDLIVWYRSEAVQLHPIELAAQLHYRFILIHPFLDGNGRTARLLTNFVLSLHDYPPGAIIRADADRRRYFAALRAVDNSVSRSDLRPSNSQLNFFPFVKFLEEEVLWSLDRAIDIIENRTIETEEDLLARIQRMEHNNLAVAGIPLDETARKRALTSAVQETTARLDKMLRPLVDKANAGLRELVIHTRSHTGPLVDLVPPASPRTRVVERVTRNTAGMAGLISTSVHRQQDSLAGLPVPWNVFEVLVAAEPHRLNIWTIIMCEVEHGHTMSRGDIDSWSGHLIVPIEADLLRETEVNAFLLKELGRFMDVVDGEMQRRLTAAKKPAP